MHTQTKSFYMYSCTVMYNNYYLWLSSKCAQLMTWGNNARLKVKNTMQTLNCYTCVCYQMGQKIRYKYILLFANNIFMQKQVNILRKPSITSHALVTINSFRGERKSTSDLLHCVYRKNHPRIMR